MTFRILCGDARETLATLPAASVHCCVTSPPYFGLRDYGSDGQIGLEATPDAYAGRLVDVFREVRRVLRDDGTLWLNLGDSYNAAGREGHGTRTGYKQGTNRASANGSDHTRPSVDSLKPKDLIGIPWLVAFALRADGWYLRSDIIWHKPNPMPESVTDRPTKAHEYLFLFAKGQQRIRLVDVADLPPERVHFGRSLGAKGAYLETAGLCVALATALFDAAQSERDFSLPPFYAQEWKERPEGGDSDFVAALPPNHRLAAHSARLLDGDTTTKEFLDQIHRLWCHLTESDLFLIRRRLAERRDSPCVSVNRDGAVAVYDSGEVRKIEFSHMRMVVTVPTGCKYYYDAEAVKEPAVKGAAGSRFDEGKTATHQLGRSSTAERTEEDGSRNRRTVWTIATHPFAEAHFATFPPALVEPCIKAGTSERGVCPECGASWERAMETERIAPAAPSGMREVARWSEKQEGNVGGRTTSRTVGWRPTCAHGAAPVPAMCLDPFNGAGTTGLVATRLQRRYTGIDVNPDYVAMSERRIRGDAPLFHGLDFGVTA